MLVICSNIQISFNHCGQFLIEDTLVQIKEQGALKKKKKKNEVKLILHFIIFIENNFPEYGYRFGDQYIAIRYEILLLLITWIQIEV